MCKKTEVEEWLPGVRKDVGNDGGFLLGEGVKARWNQVEVVCWLPRGGNVLSTTELLTLQW